MDMIVYGPAVWERIEYEVAFYTGIANVTYQREVERMETFYEALSKMTEV